MKRALFPYVALLVALAISWALTAFAGMSFWLAFFVVAAAFLINGWVATVEDDVPGGLNNPNGNDTPRYLRIVGWVIRAIGVVLALVCFATLALHFFSER